MAAAAVGAVIYNICEDWSLDFVGMFACTGRCLLAARIAAAPCSLSTRSSSSPHRCCATFACTGLWNAFFLFIYAVTDASKLMKWCTRSAATSAYLLILQGTVPGARRRGRPIEIK